MHPFIEIFMKLLFSFAFLIFFITAAIGVIAALRTEIALGTPLRGKILFYGGWVIIATATGTVAVMLLLALARLAGV